MATGLDIVSAISSIVQLIDFTCKVCDRLNEFQSGAREIPKSFRQFGLELPLLQTTFRQLNKAIKDGRVSDETTRALGPPIKRCEVQVEKLNAILEKTLPKPEDSWGEKARKAIVSLQKDSKVEQIMNSIRGYQGTLTFYFVATANSFRPRR
jgi:hypothetical protein